MVLQRIRKASRTLFQGCLIGSFSFSHGMSFLQSPIESFESVSHTHFKAAKNLSRSLIEHVELAGMLT